MIDSIIRNLIFWPESIYVIVNLLTFQFAVILHRLTEDMDRAEEEEVTLRIAAVVVHSSQRQQGAVTERALIAVEEEEAQSKILAEVEEGAVLQ